MIAAIDVGTTTMKGALFAPDGKLLKQHAVPMEHVDCEDPCRHETDPQQWIDGFGKIITALGNTKAIQALVVSGNGPNLVPVKHESGTSEKIAYHALTWMDRRSVAQAKKVTKIMGSYVDPSFFLPKALYVAEQQPEIYENTRYFMYTCGFMNFYLTGTPRTILPGSHFETWFWNNNVLAQLNLDLEKFPPYISPGEVIDTVHPKIARAYGFNHDLKIIAGGADFIVSIVGTGTVYPGLACDRAGTSEGINLCTETLITDKRLMSYGHISKPYFNLSGIITSTGSAVSWIKKILGLEMSSYAELYALAEKSVPGSKGLIFLPYLAGERAPKWDPHAKGVFMGLTSTHQNSDLIRSVSEGIVFAIRDVIEVMEETGCLVDELRVTGGPAAVGYLNQLKADITGKTVKIPVLLDSELLGDACLGAIGLGLFSSVREAADEYIEYSGSFIPDPKLYNHYSNLFEIYRETYESTKTIMHKIANLNTI